DLVTALESARDADYALGEANVLLALGNGLERAGRRDAALSQFEAAAAIYGGFGERRSEANARQGIGRIVALKGRVDEAVRIIVELLTVYRDADDRHGIATCLGTLASFAVMQSRYAQAVWLAERAAQLHAALAAPFFAGLDLKAQALAF